MTTPPGNDAWDLGRIQQIVTQNDLERGRIEYKRQLDDGRRTLEAITALANTFGGVVLVGVDETKQGLDRLTGVLATERDKLVSWCWSRLTPPFSPEIIPISLGHDDLYVLAVVINTDYIRRPVMINADNKVFVRLEGQNQAPDWYRLRDLFTEQAPGYADLSLPPADPGIYTRQGQYPDTDLALRGRLLLIGPRGRTTQITGTTRAQALAALNSNNTPLTGTGSALSSLMHEMAGNAFDARGWELDGRANTRRFSAGWQGLGPAPAGRVLTEARIRVEISPRAGQGDALLITLDALLTDSRRPATADVTNGMREIPDAVAAPIDHAEITEEDKAKISDAFRSVATHAITPFVGIGALRKLMLDITGTLWGPPGESLSVGIFGQPLGPPALLDLTIFTTPINDDSEIPPLNERIDFGAARLIPANTPGSWTNLGPIKPDRSMFSSPAAQAPLIHDWLIQFGIENGYQGIEQEVERWTGITA